MNQRVLAIVALPLLLVLAGLVPTAFAKRDAGPDNVTMVSGNGQIGGRDPFNDFLADYRLTRGPDRLTWAPAFIVRKHPRWADPIRGSKWISVAPDLGYSRPPSHILYRRFFDLPDDCGAATLSVSLHVDDDAAVETGGGLFLNGVLFGSTPPGPRAANFRGPPEGPFIATGGFQEEGNLLELRTGNIGGAWSGLDYKATLTCGGD